MEWFEAVLLGLIQGLTEILPVSSSGHLEIGKALLGLVVQLDQLGLWLLECLVGLLGR